MLKYFEKKSMMGVGYTIMAINLQPCDATFGYTNRICPNPIIKKQMMI